MRQRQHPLRASTLIVFGIVSASALLIGCASGPPPGHPGGGAAAASSSPRPGPSTAATPTTTGPGSTLIRSFRDTQSQREDGGETVQQETGARPGSCWTGSIAAPVIGAYRCLRGEQILDPCFAATPSASYANCYASPWSAVQVLRLTKPLPRPGPGVLPDKLWALQLANGARCVAETGTVEIVHGVALAYGCANGAVAGLLPSGSGYLRVDYRSRPGQAMTKVSVPVAWKG